VYLRLLYRVPALVLITLGCLGFARLTGRRRKAYRLWAILYSRVCGRELEITGAAPDPSAQLIIANHTSYLDAIPMGYLWPEARPVAMQRIRSWFLLGPLSGQGAIFVDGGVAESRRQTREEMRRVWEEGGAVIVFPEGKVSHGLRRPPFRFGSFEEAIAAGVMIQGVRISYPTELLDLLGTRRFEHRFFWVLCQNFTIRVRLVPAERAAGDAATLARIWESRLLSDKTKG
jgi:1-acyl-sn-glycerol-3-phosphate acyltransferase